MRSVAAKRRRPVQFSFLLAAATVLVALAQAERARAVSEWSNASGSWFDAEKWDGAVPSSTSFTNILRGTVQIDSEVLLDPDPPPRYAESHVLRIGEEASAAVEFLYSPLDFPGPAEGFLTCQQIQAGGDAPGTLSIEGPGLTGIESGPIASTTSLLLGLGARGEVRVTGAYFHAGDAFLGMDPNFDSTGAVSNAFVTVDGRGAYEGKNMELGYNSPAEFVLRGQSAMINANTYIGGWPDSRGQMTIEGASTADLGNLHVGGQGDGWLTIREGSYVVTDKIYVAKGPLVSEYDSARGMLRVESGAELHNDTFIRIASPEAAGGDLWITDGGRVTTQECTIGDGPAVEFGDNSAFAGLTTGQLEVEDHLTIAYANDDTWVLASTNSFVSAGRCDVGYLPGSKGKVQLLDSTELRVEGEMVVGRSGEAEVSLLGQGHVSAHSCTLAREVGSLGELRLDMSSTSFFQGDLTVGGSGLGGLIVGDTYDRDDQLFDFSRVDAANLRLGVEEGSQGAVVVSGGSQLHATEAIEVSIDAGSSPDPWFHFDDGTPLFRSQLTVRDEGSSVVCRELSVALNETADGVVEVLIGAELIVEQRLEVGGYGAGLLRCEGGQVTAHEATVAVFSGSAAAIEMDGGLFHVPSDGELLVGSGGAGELTARGGAVVRAGRATLGALPDAEGSILLEEAARLEVASRLVVAEGAEGDGDTVSGGFLAATQSSHVEAPSCVIGDQAGSFGNAVIEGGSQLYTDRLVVGRAGRGELLLRGGHAGFGTMPTFAGAEECVIGETEDGTGLVWVQDGSTLDANSLVVGQSQGGGALWVSQDSEVWAGHLIVGNHAGPSFNLVRVMDSADLVVDSDVEIGVVARGALGVEAPGGSLHGKGDAYLGMYEGADGRLIVKHSAEALIEGDLLVGGTRSQGGGQGTVYVYDLATLEVQGRLHVWPGSALHLRSFDGSYGDGIVRAGGGVDIDGTLTGSGAINGDLVVSGKIIPGTSPGTLRIEGDYTQSASGILEVEVASSSLFDVLDIGGDATLGGTLLVQFLPQYVPEPGDVFAFLAVEGDLYGQFDHVELVGLEPGGLQVRVSPTGRVALFGVPEPSAWLLALLGMPAILGLLRRSAAKRARSRVFSPAGSSMRRE